MKDRCHFVVQDYLDIKGELDCFPLRMWTSIIDISGMEENAYDAAFYMESSLHCENRTQTFKETYRLLKPGGRLVAMEYVLLPGWDPENPGALITTIVCPSMTHPYCRAC